VENLRRKGHCCIFIRGLCKGIKIRHWKFYRKLSHQNRLRLRTLAIVFFFLTEKRIITESNSHESDGEKRADDGDGVQDVPHISTIRARMKQDATINHLQVKWPRPLTYCCSAHMHCQSYKRRLHNNIFSSSLLSLFYSPHSPDAYSVCYLLDRQVF